MDPETYGDDELDLTLVFQYLMRMAYAGCEYLPEESEMVVAGVLRLIQNMLLWAPVETIGLLYGELVSGELNLLHQICNANLHKEHSFIATLQLLHVTEELLTGRLVLQNLCDTRYGEVLLWFLEAGVMRMVCSMETARFDHVRHFFLVQSACLRIVSRIAELSLVTPLRYPLALSGCQS